jgi:hypothetical protein
MSKTLSKPALFTAAMALSAALTLPALAADPTAPSSPSSHVPGTQTMTPSNQAPAMATPAPAANTMSGTATHAGSPEYVTADQQFRASKMIGASVYNDQKQKIGSIDEILFGQNNQVDSVVLSVGGFLGIGSKLVKVPYSDLQVRRDTIVMSGATKDQLTQMPGYKYTG